MAQTLTSDDLAAIAAAMAAALQLQLPPLVVAVAQLGGGRAAFAGPVAADGQTVRIVQCDDAVLQWTLAGYAGPSLTAATVALGLMSRQAYDCDPAAAADLAVPATAVVTTSADGALSVTFTAVLTAAQTATLPLAASGRPLNMVGQLIAITPGGLRQTILMAAVTVVRRVL